MRKILVYLVLMPLLFLSSPVLRAEDKKDKDENPDHWRRYRLGLSMHPIGYAHHKRGIKFDDPIPIHPAGFPARRTSVYPGPVLVLGQGLEITASVTTAETLGHDSSGILSGRPFYGAGIQKQLTSDEGGRAAAISIGGYGYTGPNDHRGGTAYLVASKRLWRSPVKDILQLYGHLGLKTETFSNNFANGTGIRPFVGANLSLSRILFLHSEWAYRQPWENSDQFSLKAKILFYKAKFGISVGIIGNGYETYPTVGVTF